MTTVNLTIRWDVSYVTLYFISIFHKKLDSPDTEEVQMQNAADLKTRTVQSFLKCPRWDLRVKSKMEDTLCKRNRIKKKKKTRNGIKSLGILGCLMVNHLLWGHDLIKTSDYYNKSLFSLDGGFKWKKKKKVTLELK